MNDNPEKRKLIFVGVVAIILLVLLLYWRKLTGIANTFIQQVSNATGIPIPQITTPDVIANIPDLNYIPGSSTLNYQGGNFSTGCSMCAGVSDYSLTTLEPFAPINIPDVVPQTVTPYSPPRSFSYAPPATQGASYGGPGMISSTSSGTAAPAQWWGGIAPGGPLF